MQSIREARQLTAALIALRAGGKSLALVPTMGALHAGHLALIEEARRKADRVAATIFVNPLQFGANEDLDRYPRQEEKDAAMLAEAGCDLLWLPAAADMYPPGFATAVSVKGLSDRWEGEARPGHFDGVATVVAKLLCAVRPDIALVRREGLPAARRYPADGAGSPARRRGPRRGDGPRSGWPGSVVAQCLSVGGRAQEGGGASARLKRGC